MHQLKRTKLLSALMEEKLSILI